MKISLDWLNDYVDTAGTAEEIAEVLSNLGFPCEGIEQVGDDTVIDIEVTSNRGDCLSYIGVAREYAAATGKELKMPKVELAESERSAGECVSVEIAEPNLCGRYTAKIIEGVKVGPSPEWMSKRLEALGHRSVNNVVDATNYAMLETGQPPHAFDSDKISGGKVIVRKAKPGERLTSIDGSECELDENMLVIADADGAVAIAGVMGGLDSEVSETTTTILLEDASFDPVSVRTTSRKLALPSEAAFRFERIVDIERIDWASQRTAQLIMQVAGGKAAKGLVDEYPCKWKAKTVTLRTERLNKLLGIEIAGDEVMRILSSLWFEPVMKEAAVECKVPSWRSDITREADLIEEVTRVYGYDNIPVETRINIEVAAVDQRQRISSAVGAFLNGCGFYETINVTFVDKTVAKLMTAAGTKGHLGVKDVTRKSANLLRQTLIGSLLGVLRSNYYAKNRPCKVFELANTFVPGDDELPVEVTKLAIVCDSGFRSLRGVVEGVVDIVNKHAKVEFKSADVCWAKAGAEIIVDGKVIGLAGVVSDKVADAFDVKEAQSCAAELDFEALMAMEGGVVKIRPIPKYPAVVRVLSLIVDEEVSWANIVGTINEKAPAELEEVGFDGVYRGKPIEAGKKSVTASMRFRDEDGTLRHETVDGFEKIIFEGLEEKLKAELRTA